MSPHMTVDQLQWEMLEWEVHWLRGMVGVMVITVQVWARDHPEVEPLAEHLVAIKDTLAVVQLEALRDPAKRGVRRESEGK